MRKHHFTLIELLIVISIIATLAGMLLPALNKAREAGRQASCLNNTKQIGFSFINYGDDNSDWRPGGSMFYYPNDGNYSCAYDWFWLLSSGDKVAGRPDLAQGYLKWSFHSTQYKVRSKGVLCCPTARRMGFNVYWINTDYMIGPYNHLSSNISVSAGNNSTYQENGVYKITHLKSNTCKTPSRVVATGDADSSGNGRYRFRHGNKANFQFMDGHSQPVHINVTKALNEANLNEEGFGFTRINIPPFNGLGIF